MHHPTLISMILIVAARLCHSQGNLTTPDSNDPDHWCGQWAGLTDPSRAPSLQLLPPRTDYTRRFFVEPQLQRTPFSPIMADEPKVQVPKFWGTNEFRIALLTRASTTRVYASSKSAWSDFATAYDKLMDACVRQQGSGGAYLVPPNGKLTDSSLVIYFYTIGSFFDYQLNEYMTKPYGINPATIQTDFLQRNVSTTRPTVDTA